MYKNTFLRFGGDVYGFFRSIYEYNVLNNSWVQLNTTSAPMDMEVSTCGVLPNYDIMIMGTRSQSSTSLSLYNVPSNTWAFLGSPPNVQYTSHIFPFGSRTFIGWSKSVYEFDNKNITFTLQPFSFFKGRGGGRSVYVPSGMLNSLPKGCKGT